MKNRLVTTVALAAIACAVAAAAAAGGPRKQLYVFRGELVNASSTSVQVQVQGGNHPALRAMIGQSQNQSFSADGHTEYLIWSHGTPRVGSVSDLKQGDWVQLNIRAPFGSSLSQVEGTPVGVLGDHGANQPGRAKPLYLYAGTVTGGQTGGHIALHVTGGNALALKRLVGQSVDQTFTYDVNTIFLMWQGKVPTVIDASQLKAGDRITIRVRAPKGSTLAQVEATPANHVGDHEPGNPESDNG
jgi:hypothetical protein